MTNVHRIVGLETEFGILEPSEPYANPVVLSADIVEAIAAASPRGNAIRWDYRGEDPLADARGYRRDRASAHPSMLTDNPQVPAPSGDAMIERLERPSPSDLRRPRAANTVLSNGARVYVDHAHPEYSSPEASTPREALTYDRAGEAIMAHGTEVLGLSGRDVRIYKNNTDGKGASYGAHENYLLDRRVDFAEIVRCFTPFFVTRPLICGSGRVGIGQRSQEAGFQISQRADFVENDVGLETTFDRPIINTRDEPHARPEEFRRLHVIGGDANHSDVSLLLKIGTTSLLASYLEEGQSLEPLHALELADPVASTWAASHDISLRAKLELAHGPAMSALDIQRRYFDILSASADSADEATAEVIEWWARVLDALESDVMSAAPWVEWVAKYQLLESMRQRDGGSWDSDKLRAIDVQWHDVSPARSLYSRLEAAGAIERLTTADDIARACAHAPENTRAYMRGGLIEAFPQAVVAAGWNGIVLDVPGHEELVRLPLNHPQRATRALVGHALEGAQSVEEFLIRLTKE